MRTYRKAIQLWKQGGTLFLLKRAVKYYRKEIFLLPESFRSHLITYRGSHELKVGGVSASFDVDNKEEANKLTRNFRSELHVYRDLLSSIKQNDVFWDVGANIGSFTCLVADVVDTRVIAFEPSPDNAEKVRQNLEMNGFEGEVLDYALSDSHGEIELVPFSENKGTGFHKPEYVRDGAKSVRVETVTGDFLVERSDILAPNVIKIDVEGMELETLEGLLGVLSRNECRLVYCEVHSDRLGSDDESRIHGLLEECEFEVKKIQDRGGNYHLKGEKRRQKQ